MKSTDLEMWVRELVSAVIETKQRCEDSRVELKASWPEPEKAADRLAGQANAARGDHILWLIGVDERNHTLIDTNPAELANWLPSVERYFDGFAPRLINDVNVRIDSYAIVALYFETEREAPYLVKYKGGAAYPEYIVPWRHGTRLTAAKREDILRILVPKQRLSALTTELGFNAFISDAANADHSPMSLSKATSFRNEEFDRAFIDGALESLPLGVRNAIFDAYSATSAARTVVLGVINSSLTAEQLAQKNSLALEAVGQCVAKIQSAKEAIDNFINSS